MAYKSSFDWQAGQEDVWETLPSPAPGLKRNRPRWALWLVSSLIIFCAAMAATVWQVKKRVAAGVDNAQRELTSGYQLVYRAVWTEDSDLFQLLLWDGDSRWSRVQRDLFEQGLFLDRAPLGLWARSPAFEASLTAGSGLPVTDTQTIFAPDLEEAQVIDRWPFTVATAGGITETILLERTLVFKKEEGRWLLAPPADEYAFWGRWVREEGESLHLIYPARDEAIGRRLFPRLDELVRKLCTSDSIECPVEFKLQLRLARDAGSLLRLYQMRSGLNVGSFHLDLPAPTLVGRPVDEAGFQAVYGGYASWVASAIVANFSRVVLVDEAVLSEYLRPFGLRPPALAESRPLQAERPPPIPLPDQDLVMLCNSFLPPRLLRYHLDTNSWTDEAESNEESRYSSILRNSQPTLSALPGDDGLIVNVRQAVEGTPRRRTFLLHDGRERLLVDEDEAYELLLPVAARQLNVQERTLIFFRAPEEASRPLSFFSVDYSDCPPSGCTILQLQGLPVWSPDGRRSILLQVRTDGGNWLSYREKNSERLVSIGPGSQPMWIDDRHFAYLRPVVYSENGLPEIDGGFELVEVSLPEYGELDTTVLLHSEELRLLLPVEQRTKAIWLRAVTQHPGEASTWFLVGTAVSDSRGGNDFIFSINRQSGEVKLMLDLKENRLQLGLLPAGGERFLSLVVWRGSGWSLLVFDLEQQRTVLRSAEWPVEPGFDWSADGQWLAWTSEGILHLVAPSVDYDRAIIHNLSGCSAVAWLNR